MSRESQRIRALLARSSRLSLGLSVAVAVSAAACKRGEGRGEAAHHYDDKEAALANFEEPERDAWAMPGKVVESLAITPNMEVADIGAGSGYFTRRLATAANGGTTYAVDIDADFKRYIETQRGSWGTPNIVTRLAVYEHPLLPRDSVELVFMSNTYSYLQDRFAYFTAIYRALRQGGRLAIIDWRDDVACPRSLGCPKPNERIPVATAITELRKVGFEVLEHHDFLKYQYFLILGRAVDRRPTPTPTGEADDPGDE